MAGFDLELVRAMSRAVSIPLIACGGAGSIADLSAAVAAGASAVAAGSLFVFAGPRRAVLINYPSAAELACRRGATGGAVTVLSGFAPAPSAADLPGVRVCTRCVMDTTDPEISFDDYGVCNHCHDYDRAIVNVVRTGVEGAKLLDAAVARIRRDGEGHRYDCVIGVSGGVDSTYVAYKVKQLGLRPLAVHLDNGWDSEVAASNISAALTKLGIDLETLVIDWEEFKDIQLAFLRSGLPDCEIPSDHAIVSSVYQVARQQQVRHCVWGYNTRTETHLPRSWSQAHFDWGFIRAVHRKFGSGHIRTFPHLPFQPVSLAADSAPPISTCSTTSTTSRPTPCRCFSASWAGAAMAASITRASIPGGTKDGFCRPASATTNARRTWSSLVCSGEITREDARQALRQPAYAEDLQRSDTEYVIKKFGLTPAEFRDIMTGPRRTFAEFSWYAKLRAGAPFRGAAPLPIRQVRPAAPERPMSVSDPMVSVEALGKRYRLRHVEQVPYVALRDVITSAMSAPLRWFGGGAPSRSAGKRISGP